MTQIIEHSQTQQQLTPEQRKGEWKKAAVIAVIGQVIVTVVVLIMINVAYGCGFNTSDYTRKKMKIGQLRDKVVDGTYWGVLAIDPKASSMLIDAAMMGAPAPASYSASYWYDQGRGGSSFGGQVGSIGNTVTALASGIIRKRLVSTFEANGFKTNSTAIASPISLYTNNLHPVLTNGAFGATGTAALQVYLIGMMHAIMCGPLHAELKGNGIPDTKLDRLFAMHRTWGSLLLSFWLPVVYFVLGTGDPSSSNAATFFALWTFTWLALAVLQHLSFMLTEVFGTPMGMLGNILFLVTMNFCSGAIFPFDSIPEFYSFGYAMPFYYIVQGSRAIMFGTLRTFLPRAIGVLFAFYAFIVLFSFRKLELHFFPEPSTEAVRRRTMRRHSAGIVIDNMKIMDPKLKPLRTRVWNKVLFVEFILSVVFIIMLLLSFGNGWRPADKLGNIKVALVNLDRQSHTSHVSPLDFLFASIAPAVNDGGFGFTLDKVNVGPSVGAVDMQISYDQIISYVSTGNYWGALVLNNGSFAALEKWLDSPASVSAPSVTALSFIYNDKRGGGFVNAQLTAYANAASGAINKAMASRLIQFGAIGENLNAAGVANPVSLALRPLHPDPGDPSSRFPGASGTVSSASLILYLGCIVQSAIINAAHEGLTKLSLPYKQRQFLKYIHAAVAAFLVGLIPAISLAWYGFPFTGDMFIQYWAVLALGFCAYMASGMAINHIFGHAGVLVSFIMFTLNQASSAATLPIELQPAFFRVGYGLPYNQIVAGGMYILFGSRKDDFHRAMWVLMLWVLVILIAATRLEERRRLAAYFSQYWRSPIEYSTDSEDLLEEDKASAAADTRLAPEGHALGMSVAPLNEEENEMSPAPLSVVLKP